MPHKSHSTCSDDYSPPRGSTRGCDPLKKKPAVSKDSKKQRKHNKHSTHNHSSDKAHLSNVHASKCSTDSSHSSKHVHVTDQSTVSVKSLSNEKYNRDHKKRKKHSKPASKDEKHNQCGNLSMKNEAVSTDSQRKHKQGKSREISKSDRKLLSNNKGSRTNSKSIVHETTLQSSVTVPNEDECGNNPQITLCESPPHTPCSTPPYSSVGSRASSYSHASTHPSSKSRVHLQSSSVDKTRKHQTKESKHSINLSTSNKNHERLLCDKQEVNSGVKSSISQGMPSKQGHPIDTSGTKSKRHESNSLSYGYSQSSQRHQSSPRHKHKHHPSNHRERSRSDSQRNKTPDSHLVARGHSRTRSRHANSKSKVGSHSDHHKHRHSKQSHRSVHESHHSYKNHSASHHRYEATSKYSSSPSPRSHKRSHRSISTKNQRSRSRSVVHSNVKYDNRRNIRDMSWSVNRKDYPNRQSHSPTIKEKSSKPQSFTSLWVLLNELCHEDISDTELELVVPSSFGCQDLGQVHVASSEHISKSQQPKNATQSTQRSDANDHKNDQSQPNSSLVLESLERLSNQIRQHMSAAESWDLNELNVPIDIDDNYTESPFNQSVVSLASVKGNILDNSEHAIANEYTPWQYLIESAGKTLPLFNTDHQPEDSIKCIGIWSEPPECRQDLITLPRRADGLEVLHITGISHVHADQKLLNRSLAGKLEETELKSLSSFPSTWKMRNSSNCTDKKGLSTKLQSSIAMMPFTRRTDVSIRQQLLRTIKCI